MVFVTRLIRVLSIVTIIIGMLFKIQHWPLASVILTVDALALTFLADFVVEEIKRKRKG